METGTPNLEQKIIQVAQTLFIEKGFAETSMSEIAEQVGINRPALHYYFRTKERMFQTVFGGIVRMLFPQIKEIITRHELPVAERISHIVDLYYATLTVHPGLPLFIIREIHRDTRPLVEFFEQQNLADEFLEIKKSLLEEMRLGQLRPQPISHIFMTFVSMLAIPLLSKEVVLNLLAPDETLDELIAHWKPTIVSQMTHLLTPLP